MRFNSLGNGLAGIGAGSVSIDGVVPAALGGLSGGGWDWITDTLIAGNGDIGAGFKLYQLPLPSPPGVVSLYNARGANTFAAGGGKAIAFLVGSGVMFLPSGTLLPLAGPGDMQADGTSAIIQNYQAGTGIGTYNAAGTRVALSSVALIGGSELRVKDNLVSYTDTTGATHLARTSDLALQAFAPRTERIFQTVPIVVAGQTWVIEANGATPALLTARPATSSNGFVINSGDAFGVDAVEVSPGVIRIGWAINAGETPTSIRMADLTVSASTVKLGSTASGSLVFGSSTSATTGGFTVGPVEGGSLSATKQPRYAGKQSAWNGETGLQIYQKWWDTIAGQAVAPPNLSQATGVLPASAGGTGTTTGLTAIDGGNILPDTTMLDTAQAFGPYVLQNGRNLILTDPLTVSTYIQLNGSANLRIV